MSERQRQRLEDPKFKTHYSDTDPVREAPKVEMQVSSTVFAKKGHGPAFNPQ